MGTFYKGFGNFKRKTKTWYCKLGLALWWSCNSKRVLIVKSMERRRNKNLDKNYKWRKIGSAILSFERKGCLAPNLQLIL